MTDDTSSDRLIDNPELPTRVSFRAGCPTDVIEAAIEGIEDAGYEANWVVRTTVEVSEPESET